MAGGRYDQKGSGANHLCLPFNPQYAPHVGNAGGSLIYGSEYHQVDQVNSRNKRIHDRNIPCAVCRVQMRSTAMMVPARMACPYSWTREYYGFLMAAHSTLAKGNYICMDREMRSLPGHAGHQLANDLYPVTTECGFGLDCPPYLASKPITCVMCTKWKVYITAAAVTQSFFALHWST